MANARQLMAARSAWSANGGDGMYKEMFLRLLDRTIEKVNDSNIITMGDQFRYCTKLTEFIAPELTTLLSGYALGNCEMLRMIKLPKLTSNNFGCSNSFTRTGNYYGVVDIRSMGTLANQAMYVARHVNLLNIDSVSSSASNALYYVGQYGIMNIDADGNNVASWIFNRSHTVEEFKRLFGTSAPMGLVINGSFHHKIVCSDGYLVNNGTTELVEKMYSDGYTEEDFDELVERLYIPA